MYCVYQSTVRHVRISYARDMYVSSVEPSGSMLLLPDAWYLSVWFSLREMNNLHFTVPFFFFLCVFVSYFQQILRGCLLMRKEERKKYALGYTWTGGMRDATTKANEKKAYTHIKWRKVKRKCHLLYVLHGTGALTHKHVYVFR